jgi:hypothetical protein
MIRRLTVPFHSRLSSSPPFYRYGTRVRQSLRIRFTSAEECFANDSPISN